MKQHVPSTRRADLATHEGLIVPRLYMPRRVVLARHGESEANIINRAIKKGKTSKYPRDFLDTPDREIRLTARGRMQARRTGVWLREQYPEGFDAYFVSNHVRAMETAGLISKVAGWKGVEWRVDPLLGERNWGVFSEESADRRERLMELRKRDPLNMPMPDGETLLYTRLRSRTQLERCHREFGGKKVLFVTHGEFIEATWSEIAHMTTEKQREFFQSKPGDLKNCQVVEFAADDPASGEWQGKLNWVRSSCPQARISGQWMLIERTKFTPEELLKTVDRYPHLDLESFDASLRRL